MNPKIFYNPCFVYGISFSSIILLYQVGWSDMFPELSNYLLGFLCSTIIFSIILSFFQNRILYLNNQDINVNSTFLKRSMYFLVIGYSLEFIYESGIPLINTLSASSYSYGDFNGIPTFHVVLSTFNIFFSILMFNYYLSSRGLKILFQFVITMIPYILILNRGAFMIVFSAMIFLFLMRLKRIKLKTIIMPFVILGAVLYFFGVVGNIRQEQTKDDKEYLLRIAGATDKFIDSGIPNEFYWSYVYLISPIGNLENIIVEKQDVLEIDNIGIFITTQLFPDFISKRLSNIFGYENIDSSAYFVTPLLNAATIYFMPYFLLGTFGLIIMFCGIMWSAWIYPSLIRTDSKYYTMSIASLNSLILLSTFNNMWFASGTILLWPIIFDLSERVKIK